MLNREWDEWKTWPRDGDIFTGKINDAWQKVKLGRL
jgi:hypothetical protein